MKTYQSERNRNENMEEGEKEEKETGGKSFNLAF